MSLCCLKGLLCSFSVGFIGIIIFKFIFNYATSFKLLSNLKNKRVLITGGSSGIGLSLAKLAYKNGAHVTIVGRNVNRLKAAEKFICEQKTIDVGSLETISADVSVDFESLKMSLQTKFGKIDVLINCAGGAISRTYMDMDHLDIEKQMRLNYFGSANVAKMFLPSMLENKKDSSIVFVSSMAGQVGLYGYGAYSASKFALRGLAECLQMEVGHLGVHITLAFPPDTRTPGFEIEQIGKPETTKRLSESAGLIEPDHVAKCIWTSVLRKDFFSSVGVDGWFLTQLTYGMVLPSSIMETLSLIMLAPISRIVALGYGFWMRHIVRATKDSS